MDRKRRQANVYDAVAGRVSTNGFMPSTPYQSKCPGAFPPGSLPHPPDEVLFRRKNAPVRYEEDDFYFANEKLKPGQRLPDSDLLKAIHMHASDFYACISPDRGRNDWHSLDETALLAFGILVEEAAKEVLGENGHRLFVEEERDMDPSAGTTSTQRSVITPNEPAINSGRSRKKRKLDPADGHT
ncbi:MAG: hypothetical protein M1834_003669 [Cirrosporium novae-zelandiae]|nr:MAG: hypothetical protein M1834_003669 [Cirrosporium novae-zelandiae]